MATLNVLGDNFLILKQGTFKTVNISWSVLEVNANQRIIVIPVAYGEEKIRTLLTNKYLFSYAKDPMTNNFYVEVKNFPDAVIYNELNNL